MATEKTIEVAADDQVEVDITDLDLPAETQDAVTAEAEGGEQQVVTVKPAKEPPPKTIEPDEAIAEAIKNSEAARLAAVQTAQAERQAREAAERRAQERDEEVKQYRERSETQELTIVSSGIEAAKRDAEAAQKEMVRALEAGEFAIAAKAQADLSEATAKRINFEQAKASLESAPKVQTIEGRVTAQPGSQFERYVSGFSPKSQAWLRSHPDCVPSEVGGNAVKNASIMLAHAKAIEDGIVPESDDYFARIDAAATGRQPVAKTTEVEETTPAAPARPKAAAPAPKPKQATPAAPPSREPPTALGQRTTRTVTLTPQQVEAAEFSYPHLPKQEARALYARELLSAQAEGKLGRTSH